MIEYVKRMEMIQSIEGKKSFTTLKLKRSLPGKGSLFLAKKRGGECGMVMEKPEVEKKDTFDLAYRGKNVFKKNAGGVHSNLKEEGGGVADDKGAWHLRSRRPGERSLEKRNI